MPIEQAIFTSARTDRANGYQLTSRSRGVHEAVARELSLWGPSHDSLWAIGAARGSTNFFRLASGDYCISRSVSAGEEFSGRGGAQIHTRFLLIPAAELQRFGNNPFALARAATAVGAFDVPENPPAELPVLTLGGRAPLVDLEVVAQLARDPGVAALASLVQALSSTDRLALVSRKPVDALIGGLFSLLPVCCRVELSFTTALKPSPAREVRLLGLPDDVAARRAIARQGFTLLDVDTLGQGEVAWQGWAGQVATVLNSGKLSLLAEAVEQAPRGLSIAQLVDWTKPGGPNLPTGQGAPLPSGAHRARLDEEHPAEHPQAVHLQAMPTADANCSIQRADASHTRRERTLAAAQSYVPKSTIEELGELLAGQSPEVLELLERVDDLIFAAIAGDARALAELEVVWPLAAGELDDRLMEQSKEQYLRCALAIWTDCIDGEETSSERAAAAIDVLCVLFEH